jgi:exocyst complex component 1
MDEAISELDSMDSLVSSYKIHLNVMIQFYPCFAVHLTIILRQTVSDDIVYIQSQNRGLQVQTQNQRALLTELENLLVLPVDTHFIQLLISSVLGNCEC